MTTETEGLKVLKREVMGQVALTLKVSADKLSLFVDSEIVESKNKIRVNKDTLVLMLKETVKPKFLNAEVLDMIAVQANAGKGMKDRKVAQGVLPVNGEDGRLEVLLKSVEIPSNGEDTRFVKEMQRVVPEMILGIVHPPTEGKAGTDVFGEEAKGKPGKPFKPLLERSIGLKPSQKEGGREYLVARQRGFLVKDKEKFRIQPVLQLKKDVDITSGNVNCCGKVEIGADVAKGFVVRARDDIFIKGRTHGSSLSSDAGSIQVEGLVLGGQGILVSAAMNISAYMTQNLRAQAGGDIIIGKDARDSVLEANGCVVMKQGHLFGGEARALGGVEARIIGSEGGTMTVLSSRTKAEVEEEAKKLKAQAEEYKKLEEAIRQKLGPFALAETEKFPELEPQQCRKINDFLTKLDDVVIARHSTEHIVEKLQSALSREPWFQVNYGQVLHKGVVIKVGEDQYLVDPYLTGPGSIEYSAASRQFKQTRYRELIGMRPQKKPEPSA